MSIRQSFARLPTARQFVTFHNTKSPLFPEGLAYFYNSFRPCRSQPQSLLAIVFCFGWLSELLRNSADFAYNKALCFQRAYLIFMTLSDRADRHTCLYSKLVGGTNARGVACLMLCRLSYFTLAGFEFSFGKFHSVQRMVASRKVRYNLKLVLAGSQNRYRNSADFAYNKALCSRGLILFL